MPIGRVQEFDAETESITAYLERVQLFITANAVEDNKKVAVLLSVIGSKTYSLLRNLLEPEKPSSKTYDVIVDTLKHHYEPKPVVIAERFRFYRRMQAPGESFATYIAELKSLARNCSFGDHLEEALRDQFVCGMRAMSVQKILLREADLTFKKAIETALSAEAAERHTTQLLHQPEVNKIVANRQAPFPKRSFKGFPKQAQPTKSNNQSRKQTSCHRCGGTDHWRSDCKFSQAVCHNCNKKGHLAKVCRSSRPRNKQHSGSRHYHMTEGTEPEETPTEADSELPLFRLDHHVVKPITVAVQINGVAVSMEVDTGAAMSVMTVSQQQKVFPQAELKPSNVVLKTYTTEALQVHGEMAAHVQYHDQSYTLPILIVDGDGPPLLGRNWLNKLKLNWGSLAYSSAASMPSLQNILNSHADVFKNELGTAKDIKVSLTTKPTAQPKFHRPRPVPLALKDVIGAEIDRLEQARILEKVDHSDWATPIVPVPKKDGQIRICGDYKVSVNPSLAIDQHPLPSAEEIFASLSGGQTFTKLDLSQAYQQLLLDDHAKELLTINTHKGLYRYTRLPFGIASAPAIFQRTMDELLQGLEHVMCYIDDIIITGKDDKEHLHLLATVLDRLQNHGFRVKKSKCVFMGDSVEYLGHRIDAQGLHPIGDKLTAICDAPPPKNASELRSFLGLLNYYGKFIPNLATTFHPLNQLLRKDAQFHWSKSCMDAFTEAKQALVSTTVLTHYNRALPLRLAADASAYGVGAVISHILPNGQEKPIAFASRTLTVSEKNYAQLEKEALALVFGVKKFHRYLYGRKFTLITDHKPLTTILHPTKCTPPLAAARLQRWALILSAYQYDIEFKPTAQHSNADGLSRLPLPTSTEPDGDMVAASCFNLAQMEALPVTAVMLGSATQTDPVLKQVFRFIKDGWPTKSHEDFSPYRRWTNELTVEGDCILWGTRVVVPQKYQEKVLTELHTGHCGMSRMKALARSYVWWPGLDKHIEEIVAACQDCRSVKSSPPTAPVHPWIHPSKPWERVHVDFAGPFKGKTYFLAIDAHSRWPEIYEMSSLTTAKTIAILRELFSRYGLPMQLVSDNGPQFTSAEFQEFMKLNGVKHIRTAPYHPASNGAAERLVQSFKQSLKASASSGLSMQRQLDNFLITYRNTPHSITQEAPSKLFLGRCLRTRLDMLVPSPTDQSREQTMIRTRTADQTRKTRSFHLGDRVMTRDFRHPTCDWKPGNIERKTGPVSYVVRLDSGLLWRRHVDHIRRYGNNNIVPSDDIAFEQVAVTVENPISTMAPQHDTPHVSVPNESVSSNNDRIPSHRYPQRNRRPVERLTY